MANTQVQFGFQPWGIAGGKSPNFAERRRTIAFNYGTALYRGDPVVSNSAGNIIIIASQSAPFAGIFWGCKYYDPVQKITVNSKYWPAPAGLNSAQVIEAYVIDDPDQLFLVASLGGAALAKANVMNNVQYNVGAGGSTVTGTSSYVIDDGNITTTSTLPFKIWDLYSTWGPPGVNGVDDTTIYNWAIVKMNNIERSAGTTGV